MEYLTYFSIDDIAKILKDLKKDRLERLENVDFEPLDYFKKNAKEGDCLRISSTLAESLEKLISIYVTAALLDYKNKNSKKQEEIENILDELLLKLSDDIKKNYQKINGDVISISMACDRTLCEDHRPDTIELFDKGEVNKIFEESLVRFQPKNLASLLAGMASRQKAEGEEKQEKQEKEPDSKPDSKADSKSGAKPDKSSKTTTETKTKTASTKKTTKTKK